MKVLARFNKRLNCDFNPGSTAWSLLCHCVLLCRSRRKGWLFEACFHACMMINIHEEWNSNATSTWYRSLLYGVLISLQSGSPTWSLQPIHCPLFSPITIPLQDSVFGKSILLAQSLCDQKMIISRPTAMSVHPAIFKSLHSHLDPLKTSWGWQGSRWKFQISARPFVIKKNYIALVKHRLISLFCDDRDQFCDEQKS